MSDPHFAPVAAPVTIASLLVQCQPEKLASVHRAIAAHPEAAIEGSDPAGKLIVVLECADDGAVSDLSHAFTRLDGVLSCNLVFHGVEPHPDEPVEEDAP